MNIQQIHSVIAMLTNQCNLACPYCFEQKNLEHMELQTAKDILLYLQQAPNKQNISLFGGEPMLEFDSIIVPLREFSYTLQKPTRFNMTTNGTLLDKERLDWILKNNIQFMLSMDGNKLTQDISRPMKDKTSSFDAIPLEYILSKKPYQCIRMTLTPNNVQELYNNYLFFESLHVKDLGVLPDLFTNWTDEKKEQIQQQILKIEEHIISTWDNSPLLFRSHAVALAEIQRIQTLSNRRTLPTCNIDYQCGMGIRGSCSVDVHGDFYACHHVAPLTHDSEWYIGNIYTGLDQERVKALCLQYDQFNIGNQLCKNCPLDKICNGGCKSNNFMITGNVNLVPDMYCFWQRSITDSAYRIALALANNEKFITFFKKSGELR